MSTTHFTGLKTTKQSGAVAALVQLIVGHLANCRTHQRIIHRSSLELDKHYVQNIERLVRVGYGWTQERIAGL